MFLVFFKYVGAYCIAIYNFKFTIYCLFTFDIFAETNAHISPTVN